MSPPEREVPIAAPSLGEEEWMALREPLETGWLTQGPQVRQFEEAFATRHRVEHALATTSCTTALHLALLALDVGPGDEVVVPAFTWVATANAVLYAGATPVFVDVSPDTYNIDPTLVGAAITERTKAVMCVHLFGLCADMPAIRGEIPEHVALIEDAACAAGAAHEGRPAGSLGNAGCFSFHPRKSITTGEGGMVTTDDDAVAARANMLRNHGASIPEEVRHSGEAPYLLPAFDVLGFNYRMTDLQAAVGLVQLSKLDAFIDERDRMAQEYSKKLADVEWLKTPVTPEGYRHGWQSYVTTLTAEAPSARDDVLARLHKVGIGGRPGTHAVTELGYYKQNFQIGDGSHPVASRLQAQTLALPLHNKMDDDDIDYVVAALKGI